MAPTFSEVDVGGGSFAPSSSSVVGATWVAHNAGPSDEGSASATVTVLVPANVTSTKSVAGTSSPLGPVTCAIVLGNARPGVQPDNSGWDLSP